MNVLFYYSRPIIPNDGGISSISLSLIKALKNNGYGIYALAKNCSNKEKYLDTQYVLPSEHSVNNKENFEFVRKFLNNKNIALVINQDPIDDEAELLWIRVKKATDVKIVSVFHNPITLSAKNYALTNQINILKNYGALVYKVLSSGLAKQILLKLYVLRNRNRYRQIVKYSDRVIVVCDGMMDELIEMLGFVPSNGLVIPNFIESLPDFISMEKKENIIIWCGQTNFGVKRLDIMLNLWERIHKSIPDWNLLILGDGPHLSEAKDLVIEKGISNVKFEGRVSPKSYYERAKFTIITSAYESFSLVNLESMAYSSVPLGFDTFPASKSMLRDLHKELYVKPYDLDSLCDRLKTLINDTHCYKLYQNNIHNYARFFEVSVVSQKWVQLLNLLTNER